MSYCDRQDDGMNWVAFLCFAGFAVLIIGSVLLWGC